MIWWMPKNKIMPKLFTNLPKMLWWNLDLSTMNKVNKNLLFSKEWSQKYPQCYQTFLVEIFLQGKEVLQVTFNLIIRPILKQMIRPSIQKIEIDLSFNQKEAIPKNCKQKMEVIKVYQKIWKQKQEGLRYLWSIPIICRRLKSNT